MTTTLVRTGPSYSPDLSLALAALNEAQRSAALADGAVLVLAGAGTGKTQTLTVRLGRMIAEGADPRRIFCVTFTNKAAREMADRAEKMAGRRIDWIGTFHGLCHRILRPRPHLASLKSGYRILDQDDSQSYVGEVLREIIDQGIGALGYVAFVRKYDLEAFTDISIRAFADETSGEVRAEMLKKGSSTLVRRLKTHCAAHISTAKDLGFLPAEVAAAVEHPKMVSLRPVEDHAHTAEERAELERSRPPVAQQMFARTWRAYEKLCVERNMVDFAGLILHVTRAMGADDGLRREIAGQFDYVLADEYQDTNGIQYLLLQLLAKDHRRIFVVGDDDQSIYGFRNADIKYIRQFQQDYPEAIIVKLEQNYRSTQHILSAAIGIVEQDPSRLGKNLYSNSGNGETLKFLEFPNSEYESEFIADTVRSEMKKWGCSYKEVAVLFRMNSMSRAIEKALVRENIPYVVRGTAFWERAEVKDAVAYLRLAVNPGDDDAFLRVLNVPKRSLGDVVVKKIVAEAREKKISYLEAARGLKETKGKMASLKEFCGIIDGLADLSGHVAAGALDFPSLMRACVVDTGLAAFYGEEKDEEKKADRHGNLEELVDLAATLAAPEDLLDQASLYVEAASKGEVDGVQLLTIHSSKGLEYKVVFLVGFEEGCLPFVKGEVMEERRLAYVALTRAKRMCYVTATAFRQGAERHTSSFLWDIPDHTYTAGHTKTYAYAPRPFGGW